MEKKLISIHQLLMRFGVTPPVLAQAVKKQGVCGWDIYGTFGAFKKDSDAAAAALSEIAAVHLAIIKCRQKDDGSSWYGQFTDGCRPIHQLGWFEDSLPNFEKIQKSLGSQPEYDVPESRAETDLAIIGALLYLILGKVGNGPHPHYSSQQQIIDCIDDKFCTYKVPGLNERTLTEKFSSVNKYFKSKSE
jgi:hypothetical protein